MLDVLLDISNENFGRRLQGLRGSMHFNLKQASKVTGIKVDQIRKWEAGHIVKKDGEYDVDLINYYTDLWGYRVAVRGFSRWE